MKFTIKLLYLLILFCSLQSCTPLFLKGFGMKKMKVLSTKQIIKQGVKYGIPENDAFELDSSYVDYLFSLDSIRYKKEQKNHFQPLQALYYDQTGQIKSFHINCNAGGFPNLKWNRFGTFDEFIPKQQTPLDSILPLQKHLDYLKPLNANPIVGFGEYDFVIVVHWSRFMGRQSKRLIKIVQENAALNKSFKVKILYVNNDAIFAKAEDF